MSSTNGPDAGCTEPISNMKVGFHKQQVSCRLNFVLAHKSHKLSALCKSAEIKASVCFSVVTHTESRWVGAPSWWAPSCQLRCGRIELQQKKQSQDSPATPRRSQHHIPGRPSEPRPECSRQAGKGRFAFCQGNSQSEGV